MGTDTERDSALLHTRDWIVLATLTLKSGDLIWSHSERFFRCPIHERGQNRWQTALS